MDSYRQRQVSQSDCKINSNCAKKEMIGYYQGGWKKKINTLLEQSTLLAFYVTSQQWILAKFINEN